MFIWQAYGEYIPHVDVTWNRRLRLSMLTLPELLSKYLSIPSGRSSLCKAVPLQAYTYIHTASTYVRKRSTTILTLQCADKIVEGYSYIYIWIVAPMHIISYHQVNHNSHACRSKIGIYSHRNLLISALYISTAAGMATCTCALDWRLGFYLH